jgi:diguanylate cyclase (GGDEF)-like protein
VSPTDARRPLPTPSPGGRRRRSPLPAILVLAGLTAGIVAISGGGQAVWLSLPAGLLAAALASSRRGAAAATGLIIGLTLVLSLGLAAPGTRPSAVLLIGVAGACATILVAVRERLERDQARLREFALSDAVTGVANRRSLMIRAEYEIARHGRTGREFALVMIDLDGFKGLNDRFGHAAGDDLLREVARSLAHEMRAQDTVARFGGDEFCVLAPETDEAGAERLALRVQTAIGRVSAGMDGAVSGSAGVAIFPLDGTSLGELMAAADARLLEAKRALYRGRPSSARRAA